MTGSPAETRYRDGARRIVPIAIAGGIFAASFAVLAPAAGFSRVQAVVMSATTFAGSAQFAAISILGTGGSVAAAVLAAALLNARYAPISVTVADQFTGNPLRRLLEAQLIVDESWAISRRPDGRYDRHLLIGAGLLMYCTWVGGTALGTLIGEALGDPKRYGLDAAFPALFLALLVTQVRTRPALAAAVAGGLIALVLIPFTPAGVPIIAATAACLIGLRRS
ncbi:MAG TPA: AzlC family ABC transporter permease [Gaiellaceae bacterium]